VSSFAWALPLALQLKLGVLGAWPQIEPRIIERLDDILRRVDKKGEPLPLDLTIEKAHRGLVTQFGLPADLIEAPIFALRVYHYFKARNRPEATLLNFAEISRRPNRLAEMRMFECRLSPEAVMPAQAGTRHRRSARRKSRRNIYLSP
jgi:hypothetical protein